MTPGEAFAGSSPRVLIVLDTCSEWSRGALRGFSRVGHEQGWTILHYHPDIDLRWAKAQLRPHAAVLGPAFAGPWPEPLRRIVSVSVNFDRSAEGIASVCLDEGRIADRALAHLLGRGFRNVTVFRFDDSPFAVSRERHFNEAAQRAGALVQPGWSTHAAAPHIEDRAAITAWLARLERPCGIFTCCDAWARVVARYARTARLRVPDDLALVGADNDLVECELMAPPLSSVAIPWLELGAQAADLVRLGLRRRSSAAKRVVVQPLDVVIRRSSDVFAATDPLVAAAVRWIHSHVPKRMNVPAVAKAVGATRQRLERHFRRALDRTVLQEIRRARIEIARRLLFETDLAVSDVALQSGFSSAALLSVAFHREVGTPPSVYRRRARGAAPAKALGARRSVTD